MMDCLCSYQCCGTSLVQWLACVVVLYSIRDKQPSAQAQASQVGHLSVVRVPEMPFRISWSCEVPLTAYANI